MMQFAIMERKKIAANPTGFPHEQMDEQRLENFIMIWGIFRKPNFIRPYQEKKQVSLMKAL